MVPVTTTRTTSQPLTNWAGNLTYGATVLHEPRTLDEVRELAASRSGLHVLGSRHCFNDIADSAELLTLDHLPTEVDVDTSARTVRVGGAVRYGTLAEALHAQGWAVHNLASLPHISVAGAVATATHGSGDARRNLSAAVAGMEVVTSDGSVQTLTRQDDDLAGAVVHLGALGVVTSVTLDVEPTFDVAQEVYTGLAWATALEHFDELTGSADSVSLFTDWQGDAVAQVWRKSRVTPGWAPRTDLLGASPSTVALHPLPGLDAESTTEQLGVPGPWHERLPHFRMAFTPSNGEELQSEYLVPREHGPAAIEAVRALRDRVTPLLLVSEVRTIASDDLWLSTASRQDSVALHFTWRPMQPEVEALLPVLEEALAPFGSRPHWGKLFSPDVAGAPGRLAELYPRLSDFRALVGRTDARGAFRNAWLERHGLVP